jgi:unsaturated rhamnogalacturonyl hydrolase
MSRFLLMLILASATAIAAADNARFDGASPLEWSGRLARAEMERRGPSLTQGGAPNARWDYVNGLFSYALLTLGARTNDARLTSYGAAIVESFIRSDGAIDTYKDEDYNLDMITPGRAVLFRYEQHEDDRLRKALERLRRQLSRQPRTSEGGFWHKQRYPYQMWLDGVYMASPFYARYAKVFHEPAAFDDVTRQVLLIDRHLYDARAGLYYHGWDEKKEQSWADPKTGHSPNFWGRAVGWYAMAVADILDELPPDHPQAKAVDRVFQRVAAGLARWQDPETGVWWQVLDQGLRPGNYREATASCMAVYALAKGINQGRLPRDKYLPIVQKGYAGILREFVRKDSEGRPSLTRCCEVAGLGYTAASGRSRDGSFEYYVSEPIVENDLKGIGPFILAGLEMERLLDADKKPAPPGSP